MQKQTKLSNKNMAVRNKTLFIADEIYYITLKKKGRIP